jgi:hypothetical protein
MLPAVAGIEISRSCCLAAKPASSQHSPAPHQRMHLTPPLKLAIGNLLPEAWWRSLPLGPKLAPGAAKGWSGSRASKWEAQERRSSRQSGCFACRSLLVRPCPLLCPSSSLLRLVQLGSRQHVSGPQRGTLACSTQAHPCKLRGAARSMRSRAAAHSSRQLWATPAQQLSFYLLPLRLR